VIDSGNAVYAFKALSYVTADEVLWDEYYKASRQEAQTPMRYVLTLPSLRWAFWTLLVGVILFMIFMGRRRQRIIPVILALPNTTLDFAHTVAQLYYHHGDHKNIAEKKITYFLEHLRSTFGVNTSDRGEGTFGAIAARAGMDADRVRSIFNYIDSIQASQRVDPPQLMALNEAIERFHADSKRRGAPVGLN
jgi:hypothetical protein